VLCPQILEGSPKRPTHAFRARNLDVMTEQARTDLAQQLGVPASEIQIKQVIPAFWADAGLGCSPGTSLPSEIKEQGHVSVALLFS
jgi:hypothetical protein